MQVWLAPPASQYSDSFSCSHSHCWQLSADHKMFFWQWKLQGEQRWLEYASQYWVSCMSFVTFHHSSVIACDFFFNVLQCFPLKLKNPLFLFFFSSNKSLLRLAAFSCFSKWKVTGRESEGEQQGQQRFQKVFPVSVMGRDWQSLLLEWNPYVKSCCGADDDGKRSD